MLFNFFFTRLRDFQFWTLLGFAVTVPFSKALANIFIVATAVLWVVQCGYERKLLFPKTPFNLIIGLFILSLLLSFLETQHWDLSVRGITKVLQRFGLFFLTIHVLDSTERFRSFIQFLSIGFFVILVSGLSQYLFGIDFLRHRPVRVVGRFPRITSSFEFASQYASYLIYLIFLYGFLSWNKSFSPFKRAFFAALGLTGLLSLLATQSRAGWISFFGALILSSLFLKRAFLALAGILTISFFILMASPTDLLIHRNQYGHEQSVSERWTLWHRAFEMFRSKPLTGIGINTYNAESARFLSEKKEIINREGKVVKVVDVLPQYYAHNSYLQLAAESGIVSLLLFLVFLGLFFITSIRTIRTANLNSWDKSVLQAVTAGTFGFLILNLFESMFFSVQPAQFFYFFLALGTSLIGIAKMRKV